MDNRIEMFAIMAELEAPGKWNIVGITGPGLPPTPCVGSNYDKVKEFYWPLVADEVKTRFNAKIVRFIEAGH